MSSSADPFFAQIAERIADQAFKLLSARLSAASEPLAFSIDQAAKKLNLSRSTVKTMIRDRELAVVRRGTRVLITLRALEGWLDRNET
jgi:excisionase family DNA binding protein